MEAAANGTACTPCGVGNYSHGLDMARCVPCPAGTTPGDNATRCRPQLCGANEIYDSSKKECVCAAGSYDTAMYGYICCFARSVTDHSVDHDERCSQPAEIAASLNSPRSSPRLCLPCPPCAQCLKEAELSELYTPRINASQLSLAGTFSIADGFQLSRDGREKVRSPQPSVEMISVFKCPHDDLARAGCDGWVETMVGKKMALADKVDTHTTSAQNECAEACCQRAACKSFDYIEGAAAGQCQLNSRVLDSATDTDFVAEEGSKHYERPFACTSADPGAGPRIEDTGCSPGYAGHLCGSCAERFVSARDGMSCTPCADYIDDLMDFFHWALALAAVLTVRRYVTLRRTPRRGGHTHRTE